MYSLIARNFTSFPCMLYILGNDKAIENICLIPMLTYNVILRSSQTSDIKMNYMFYMLQGWDYVKLTLNHIPFMISIYEKDIDQFCTKTTVCFDNKTCNNRNSVVLYNCSCCHNGILPDYITLK